MEMVTNPGFLMLAGILAAAIVGVYSIVYFDNKKRAVRQKKDFSKVNKRYYQLYNNFFTRRQFRKIVEQISMLSIYNFQEIRIMAINFYIKSQVIMAIMVIASAFVLKDIITLFVVVLYASVVRTVLINKQIDASHVKLIRQMSQMLSSLRESYTRLGDIPDAINECSKGNLLQKPMEQIYLIVTATDGAEKLDNFFRTCQFRLLKTLACVCYILNDTGDSVTSEGISTFKTGIQLIKTEVDLEIRKRTMEKMMFQMLEYLPIVPIFAIGAVEWFFLGNIPGTSVIYKGVLGYIMRLLIVVASFVGYYLITTINSPSFVRANDRLPSVDLMLRNRRFRRFVKGAEIKKGVGRLKLNRKLRSCLSMKDRTYIYGEKILFAGTAFLLAFLASLLIVSMSKEFTYKNTKSLSLIGGTQLTAMEEESLFKLDAAVLEMDNFPGDQFILNELQGALPKASEMDRLDQLDRMKKKYESYHNIYYRWYYVLIVYGVALAVWFCPDFLLSLRGYMVKTEAEEDVLQMQTLITILMETSLDTLDVLHWLEKNSMVHKDQLLFAFHEYPSDPEKALDRLKSKSTVPEFHQICDKLQSTIHQISVKEAFSDLVSERNHIMQIREMVQEASIKSKRQIASPLSLAPIMILAFGYVLLPIGILGYMEFVKAFSSTGF